MIFFSLQDHPSPLPIRTYTQQLSSIYTINDLVETRFLTGARIFFILLQAKRTKKVGVVGKYGVRYGASLRKQVKKMEITQHSKYTCTFCGRVSNPSRSCRGVLVAEHLDISVFIKEGEQDNLEPPAVTWGT